MNKNMITNIVGAIGATALSVGPVLEGVSSSSLHSGDWISLLSAFMFGLLGYFSNK